MKIKIFGLITCLFLIFGLCLMSVYANDDSGKIVKRVISVVYDDSTSMDANDNWAYASYSLQNMIGLMNKNDELNVVRMSDLKNVGVELLNDSDRAKDISLVGGWSTVGGTNLVAIELAGNWLKSKKEEYKNSQTVEFWLVILTDGGFGDDASYAYMEKYFNNFNCTAEAN